MGSSQRSCTGARLAIPSATFRIRSPGGLRLPSAGESSHARGTVAWPRLSVAAAAQAVDDAKIVAASRDGR
jgi:hypothetical protein